MLGEINASDLKAICVGINLLYMTCNNRGYLRSCYYIRTVESLVPGIGSAKISFSFILKVSPKTKWPLCIYLLCLVLCSMEIGIQCETMLELQEGLGLLSHGQEHLSLSIKALQKNEKHNFKWQLPGFPVSPSTAQPCIWQVLLLTSFSN